MKGLEIRPEHSREALVELRTASILIVDDEEDHLILLAHALRKAGCETIHTVSNPYTAPDMHRMLNPDLVLLDYRLPPLDGFQVLDQLWEGVPVDDRSPVIMITGGAPDSVRVTALERGVSDFLQSPSDMMELVFRVRNTLRMHSLLKRVRAQVQTLDEQVRIRTAELEEARKDVLDRLAMAAEFRDDQTGDHARRVGTLSKQISEELKLDPEFCIAISSAALLHDLGKIAMPDAVLLKPAALTAEEFEVIRSHPEIGAKILIGCEEPVLLMAREIALTHHERWDGQGYPNQLAQDQIPLCGRIVAVADAYDAMTSARPYKDAIPVQDAVSEVLRCQGAQFDPTVVAAFVRVFERQLSEDPADGHPQ